MKETYKDDSGRYDVPVNVLEHSYGSMATQSGEEADRLASDLPLVWLRFEKRETCIMTYRTDHTY